MVERHKLTDEHCDLWREGCAMLDAMTKREHRQAESDRYFAFLQINKKLTWHLVGPHSCSLFSSELDGPPTAPSHYAIAIDWPTAQTWRRALIDATGLTPKWHSYE
jgi:hypothetical protein